MSAVITIHRCIARCASHVDGRGPWQAERACAQALTKAGGSPRIAADVAAAARRIGEWLKEAA